MDHPPRFLALAAILGLAGFTTISPLTAHAADAAWMWRAPLPQGNTLSAAAASPDTVVVLDGAGTYQSKQILTWKSSNPSWVAPKVDTPWGLRAVTWTGDRFVAAGERSEEGFFQSTDGINWSRIRGTSVNGAPVLQLASVGDTVVGITSNRKVWCSTDKGATWALSGELPSDGYTKMASNGQIFVAVGSSGKVASSSDGKTWTTRASGTTAQFQSLASNGSGFVAVGFVFNAGLMTSVFIKSSDGITWSQPEELPLDNWGSPRLFNSVFRCGNGYLAYAGEYFTSPDGSTWTSVGDEVFGNWPSSSPSDVQATSPVPGDSSKTFLFGQGGLIATFNGSNFETVVDNYLGGSISSGDIGSAAGLNNILLGVKMNGRFIESTDSTNFTSESFSSVQAVQRIGDKLVKCSYNNGISSGTFESTTDGATWSRLGTANFNAPDEDNRQGGVASFAGREQGPVVAVVLRTDTTNWPHRITPELYRSTDWNTWVQVPVATAGLAPYDSGWAPTAPTPQVQWDGSRFLLLAQSGRLWSSTDGASWVALPALPNDTAAYLSVNYWPGAPVSNLIYSFASNGSKIVARAGKADSGSFSARGPDRFFVYSNGSWKMTQLKEDSWGNGHNVVWNGSIFASGSRRTNLNTSPDGVTWTVRELGADVSNLVWTGSQFAGFTDFYGILTHPTGLSPVVPTGPYAEISPETLTAPSDGGIVTVDMKSDSSWSVSESLAWVTPVQSSGFYSDTIELRIAPNTTPLERTGAVKIVVKTLAATPTTLTTKTITIKQSGYISVGGSAQIVGSAGGSPTVNVSSPSPWKVTNTAKWLNVAAPGMSGDGTVPAGDNKTVTFTVQPNPLTTVRTATISLGGVPFTITQEAATRAITGNAGSFSVPVASKTSWTANSDAAWAILGKTSGTGAGNVPVTLQENPTSTARNATLTINGLTYKVAQSGQTIPLLHKGTYTGIVFPGAQQPALFTESRNSVFNDISDISGGITLTVTAGSNGTATYTGTLRMNGLTYTGKGSVNSAGTPWTISGPWTTSASPARTVNVNLNFVVDSANTKLVRGTVNDGSGALGALAGKQIYNGSSMQYAGRAQYVAKIGKAWPAAVSVSLSKAGVATFAGKFVDGTPLTMTVPVFGATGMDTEWGLLFFNSIYGAKGTLGGFYSESSDPADPSIILSTGSTTAWLPARAELPATDIARKLADDSAAHFELLPYNKPAANQAAIIWPANGAKPGFSDGQIDIPSVPPLTDPISAQIWLDNKKNAMSFATTQGANSKKFTFAFAPATGLLEGSFTIPVSHPENGAVSLGTRVVKFYGVAKQDFDNARANDGIEAFFLSPTISVKSIKDPSKMAEIIGKVLPGTLGRPVTNKFNITVAGKPLTVERWGTGPKAVVFFGYMPFTMADDLKTKFSAEDFQNLVGSEYSMFLWTYPDAAPFSQAESKFDAFVQDPDLALQNRLDFSTYASSVVSQIRAATGLTNVCLVGNSFGAGVVMADMAALASDPNVCFVLISPTEIFMPMTPPADNPLPRTILTTDALWDYYVYSVNAYLYLDARANGSLPDGYKPGTDNPHFIIGESASLPYVFDLIGQAFNLP